MPGRRRSSFRRMMHDPPPRRRRPAGDATLLIIDDGGDATLLIPEGVKAEEEYKKSRIIPDPASTNNTEFQIVLLIIRDSLKVDPKKFRKMKERLVGVSEETTLVLRDSTRCRLPGQSSSLRSMSTTPSPIREVRQPVLMPSLSSRRTHEHSACFRR